MQAKKIKIMIIFQTKLLVRTIVFKLPQHLASTAVAVIFEISPNIQYAKCRFIV